MIQDNIKLVGKVLGIVIILSMIIAFSGCDNNDDEMTPDIAGDVTLSSDPDLGDILVDGNGRTLYLFARDVDGESNCMEGTCLDNWPIFYSENINTGAGLDPSDFGTLNRSDGMTQTTYLGWPLYYYAGDSESGDVNGEAVGNVWFVAKPDYSIMIGMEQLVGADGNNYTSDYSLGEENTMFFTDSDGRTLYIFINDEENTNNFTNEDFSNNSVWPIFHVEIDELPSTLNRNDFGEIDVFGEPQLTYKGWPLYYFGSDENRGETKGVSVPTPGVWPVVNKDITPAN